MIYSVFTNGGGLAIDASGNLYGEDGNQNVFKLSRYIIDFWLATNIHTFAVYPMGSIPRAGLRSIAPAMFTGRPITVDLPH
jgi:hypothetical protein